MEQKRLSLNGNWVLEQCGTDKSYEAVVPGCNYLDLMAAKVIEDPFYGVNETKSQWVGKTDWQYIRSFEVSENMLDCDSVRLVCCQLDTICDVFINNKLVHKGSNAHIKYEIDIKKQLLAGENNIRIRFASPVNYVKEKFNQEPTSLNGNGQNGIPHIRKAQCHFGWDWGPVLPLSGITDDIYIICENTAKISDFKITQHHNEDTVQLTFNAGYESFTEDFQYTFAVTVTEPGGNVIKANNIEDGIIITSPQLWWTADQSEADQQPLYEVELSLLKGKKIIDTTKRRIGLRTLVLDRSKDEYGNNFCFILNGVPLFAKGANLIPSDSFMTRFDETKLKELIDAALFSNMNMLRIWGGGFYGSDALYDLCDKKGILLWQDFMFACQAYPLFDNELRQNVIDEVEYNVKRLRHHASLALWCGNNEVESLMGSWLHMRKYVEWTEKFFWDILPREVAKYDDVTPFTPGTPIGRSFNKEVGSDNIGDTHLWEVWHGLLPMKYYRKRPTRFCSEYGFESLPELNAIKKFATQADYDLNSEVFTAHQKCNSGNMRMVYYIADRFKLPEKFEDFIYMSQVAQQECVGDAAEYWRRNKGRCNGALYWQLNDCWGTCSWASMDYYGGYKALQYTSRHFFAPVEANFDDDGGKLAVKVINDTRFERKLKLVVKVFDFKSGVIFESMKNLKVKAVSSETGYVMADSMLRTLDKKSTGVMAQIIEDDKVINQKTYYFDYEKRLKLPKTHIKTDITFDDSHMNITLSSDVLAKLVYVRSCSSKPLNDNFFDILPGESVTISQPIDKAFEINELKKSVVVTDCTDLSVGGSPLSDYMKKMSVLLRPLCFFPYLYDKYKKI